MNISIWMMPFSHHRNKTYKSKQDHNRSKYKMFLHQKHHLIIKRKRPNLVTNKSNNRLRVHLVGHMHKLMLIRCLHQILIYKWVKNWEMERMKMKYCKISHNIWRKDNRLYWA
jgi:hypothetical protein